MTVRKILIRLGSMRITLACFILMMVLVVIGTLAQVPLGTYEAQKQYFDSVWVYAHAGPLRVPVFPGGLLIGAAWMVNLVAAYALRFPFRWKNAGVVLIHLGLVVLFGGQFLTQLLSTESQMPIEVGQSSNRSESSRHAELAITLTSQPEYDQVHAIRDTQLAREGTITIPGQPFQIKVKKYFKNAELRMTAPGGQPAATQGVGQRVSLGELPPVSSDEEVNNTAAVIEVFDSAGKSLGVWLAAMALGAPQSFFAGGNEYQIAIRPVRYYYPFTLKLKEFRHDRYPGTDIPKNFSSLVRLTDMETGENRDALIYMNHPLRYRGYTFYQASFGKDDRLSVLQVVKNPVWITPYVSCVLVVLGLAIQFFAHLSVFLRKRNEAPAY